MSRALRVHQIDQLLQQRRVVTREQFLEALECSRATFKRDLEFLRDQLNAPIVYDAEQGGYRLDTASAYGPRYALPGLWFNASEIHALLIFDQLLEGLEPGLLGPHVQPLRARLRGLLAAEGDDPAQLARRIRLIQSLRRSAPAEHFQTVARAVMDRRCLRLRHLNRQTGEVSERIVSPQRLAYYRENWYLDAWCHLRQALRSFAIDALTAVERLPETALDLDDARLDAQLGAGYGIFGGEVTAVAELEFSATRARWVGRQQWHPQQEATWLPDGRLRLRVPYADDRELLNDILSYLPDVTVLAPEALRRRLRAVLDAARTAHADAGEG